MKNYKSQLFVLDILEEGLIKMKIKIDMKRQEILREHLEILELFTEDDLIENPEDSDEDDILDNTGMVDLELIIPKKENKAGRPIKLDKKPKEERVKFHNKRLKETGYYTEYYKNRSQEVACPCCNKHVKLFNLAQHKKSKKCRLIQEFVVQEIDLNY